MVVKYMMQMVAVQASKVYYVIHLSYSNFMMQNLKLLVNSDSQVHQRLKVNSLSARKAFLSLVTTWVQ